MLAHRLKLTAPLGEFMSSIKTRNGLVAAAFALVLALPAAPAGAQGPGSDLEEVTVTARKRTESLQNVPIAITAVSEADFRRQQFSDLKDMAYSIPNFNVYNNQTTTNSSAPYIRGLGQDDSTPVQEQGVATYVDDVYMARSQGALVDLLDFERIEVLRGPQGTLYGRNSSGGAIRFITRKPDLENLRFSADATFGNFDRQDFRLSLSTPVAVGSTAVKFDIVSRDRAGYMTRQRDQRDVQRMDRVAGRVAVRHKFSEDVMLDVVFDAAQDRSGMQAPTPIGPMAGGSLPGGYAPLTGDIYTTAADAPDINTFDGWGASATLTWDTSAGQFKSVSALRKFDNEFGSDLGGRTGNLDLYRNLDDRQFTQELQLASNSEGRVDWVVGAFFLDETFHNKDAFLFLHDYTQQSESVAGYGELTFAFTDALNLTVGGRYTQDKKTIDMNFTGLGGTFSVKNLKKSFSEFSPKVGIDWKLSSDVMLYGSVSNGYKAGAFQGFPQNLTDLTVEVLKPETVRAYEIGAKTGWAGGRVTLNGALFFSDYKDKQLNAFNPGTLGFVARSVDAEIQGAELELTARPNEALSIFASAGYIDAKITKSAFPTDPLVPRKGLKLAFVPELSAKVGFSYDIGVSSGGAIVLGANIAYQSKVYFAVTNEPFAVQKAHELVDAQIGYRSADKRWQTTLGVRNATDVAWAFTGALIDGGTLWMAEPRTYSINIRYSNN